MKALLLEQEENSVGLHWLCEVMVQYQTASQLAAGCVAIRARAYAEQFAHRYTHYRKATASHYCSVTMALDK